MVDQDDLELFTKGFPGGVLPDAVRTAFEYADEEGPFIARAFSMPASIHRRTEEVLGPRKAARFVAFGKDLTGSLYGFWLSEGRTIDHAPIAVIDPAGAHRVLANAFDELLALLWLGHKETGRVKDWSAPAEVTSSVRDFRAFVKRAFGIDAPADPAAIVARAQAAHPDFAAWVASNDEPSKPPAASGAPKDIATPGTTALPTLTAALRPGEKLPIALVKLFEFARGIGGFFAGNFEVDEDQVDAARAWFQGDAAAAGEFLLFGHDGTGSLYGFWRHDGLPIQRVPIVFLDSEGARCNVMADSVEDFLAILALGKRDPGWTVDETDPVEEDDELRAFRAWLASQFGIQPVRDSKAAVAAAAAKHPSLDAWVEQWLARKNAQ